MYILFLLINIFVVFDSIYLKLKLHQNL